MREFDGDANDPSSRQIYSAQSGERGLEIVKELWQTHQLAFKLIFMDLNLEEDHWDGFESTRQILSFYEGEGAALPVVCAQTGDSADRVENEAKAAGITQIL